MTVQETVRGVVTAVLTDEQWSALFSWATDVLTGKVDGLDDGLGTTKLIYHVNRGETHLAASEFSKWCLVRGNIDSRVLANRRAEAQHFMGMYHVSSVSR